MLAEGMSRQAVSSLASRIYVDCLQAYAFFISACFHCLSRAIWVLRFQVVAQSLCGEKTAEGCSEEESEFVLEMVCAERYCSFGVHEEHTGFRA